MDGGDFPIRGVGKGRGPETVNNGKLKIIDSKN